MFQLHLTVSLLAVGLACTASIRLDGPSLTGGTCRAPHLEAPSPLGNCRENFLQSLLPAEATIEAVSHITNGSSYGEGPVLNPAYPTNPTNLPELCAVTVNVSSSARSNYRFGLLLPTQWNNRFLAVGNGGFAGGINWLDAGVGARYGFATMSTDTGHNSTSSDLTWALHNPERQTDFGYRAMHGSVVFSKALVNGYYGEAPNKSYYSGCSTGGRQGLKEAQLYSDSFDGMLIGAPAWWSTGLAVWTTRIGVNNLPLTGAGHITIPQIMGLAAEVKKQCDSVDGVADGIISAPENCTFDFTKVTCGTPGVNASTCLTEAQVVTAKNVYADYLVNDKLAFPGLLLGSENLWLVMMTGSAPIPLGQDYVRYFLLGDPSWNWTRFNDSIMTLAADQDPGHLTADHFDGLSEFQSRGGRILMYHGDADALIPTRSSDYFYNRTAEAMRPESGEIRDWFRYFRVPGMGHCAGSAVDAPWYFAGANQAGGLGTDRFSVAGFEDNEHDALLALVDWVEKGRPVDAIIATAWRNGSVPESGVLRQRALCPVPKRAVLESGGDEKSAKSWRCT